MAFLYVSFFESLFYLTVSDTVSFPISDLSKASEDIAAVLKSTLVNELHMTKVYNAVQGFQHTQVMIVRVRVL